jgi:hypothetical protein
MGPAVWEEKDHLGNRLSRTLRDGSSEVALSQALRARLRSHRPPGTFSNKL